MKRMSWDSGALALIVALAFGAHVVRAFEDRPVELPKKVPERDLDLYLVKKNFAVGPRVSVPPLELKDIPHFKPVTLADLPDFMAEVERKVTKTGKVNVSGLLSTINYDEFPERKVEGDRELKLKLPPDLTGFKEEVAVHTFWQEGKAPLAVTLLGFTEAATDHNARAYQADLFNAGNHVLSFDSIIRNNMNRATGHGVAGNFQAEGALCAQIIDSVLRMKDPKTGVPFREKVTTVRLVGFSYGGNLTMQVLRDPKVKEWSVDRVLVVSTPVNFWTTAQLFDLYHWADQRHFSVLSLAKLLKGYSPKGEVPTEREESLLRAGLGYAFHGDMSLIFEDNIKRYMPELMEELRAFDETEEVIAHRKKAEALVREENAAAMAELERQKDQLNEEEYKERKRHVEEGCKARLAFASCRLDSIRDWTFRHGRFLVVRPYWYPKTDHTDFACLKELMKGAPNFVQVVIAHDDPLNLHSDVAALKAAVREPQLIVLPHGGHLGIGGTQWFQALMGKFFAAR